MKNKRKINFNLLVAGKFRFLMKITLQVYVKIVRSEFLDGEEDGSRNFIE